MKKSFFKQWNKKWPRVILRLLVSIFNVKTYSKVNIYVEKSPLGQFFTRVNFIDTSESILWCGRFDSLEKNNSRNNVWKFITINQFMEFFYLQTFNSNMFLTYSVDLVKHLEYILHLYSFLVENHANILKRSKHFKILQEFYQKLSLWNKYITDIIVLLNTETHVQTRLLKIYLKLALQLKLPKKLWNKNLLLHVSV